MRYTLSSLFAFCSAVLLSSFALLEDEVGKAGYYADSLHGRKTASGEKYDKYEFTCAHKSLAFGTKIRVTRLDNKKSVVVRVNDRGPYTEGFIVDLSRAAAEEIDLIKIGITRVKVEILEAGSSARVAAETNGDPQPLIDRNENKAPKSSVTPVQDSALPAASAGTKGAPAEAAAPVKLPVELYSMDLQPSRKVGFGVQVTTLYDADNVMPTVKKIQEEWPALALVSVERDEAFKKSTYRIIIGPFVDKKVAEVQQKAAAKKGYKGCFVVDLSGL